MDDSRPVILFDGHCNFCNAAIRWVARRDPHGRLLFARLQSRAARSVLFLAAPEVDSGALPDSIVLVDEDGVHTASTAVLRIARRLRFPWPLLAVAFVAPRPLRDAAYRILARNRYRRFGRSAACPAPPPAFASRFLETETEKDLNPCDEGPPA